MKITDFPRVNRYWLIPATLLLLAACADESNLEQPTELLPLDTDYYLDVDWHASTGAGAEEQYVLLHPLILKDIAVTASRNGILNVISLSTGKFESDIELDSTISAGVGGNEDIWLVATRDAYIIAIDGRKRQELWRTRVSSEVLAKPVIHSNTVVARTVDGKIVSLDLQTGNIRWQYQRVIPDLTLRGTSEPLLTRDRIIAGLADGRLIAISPENGEVIWDTVLATPTGRSEIQRLVDIDGDTEIYGRILYAASFQGRIAAIDIERGQFLWARDFSTYTGLVVDEKMLYTTDDKGHIWALDRLNGATVWKQDKLAYRKVTRPTIIGDYLAVGDFEGYVHILSRYDGRFIARYQLGQFDDIGWDLAVGIIVPPITWDEDSMVVVTRGGIAYVLSLYQKDDEI